MTVNQLTITITGTKNRPQNRYHSQKLIKKQTSNMHRSDFQYQLPKNRIAQAPAQPRDSSKLLVVRRSDGTLSDHIFSDLPKLLPSPTLVVRNNTKVISARLFGKKETGGSVEILLLKDISTPKTGQALWSCFTKPGIKLGQKVILNNNISALCINDDGYERHLEFSLSPDAFAKEIEKIGQLPLPPYISSTANKSQLQKQYQTSYAQHSGSVAAPTAGLHFTPQVDAGLHQHGVEIAEVTLHVGRGTFQPVKVADVTQHTMHSETASISETTAKHINRAKLNQDTVLAVGTTSTRTLESFVDNNDSVGAGTKEAQLFIYPPYPFRVVDALLTNFHLPESTLLMMVAAFTSAPQTNQPFTTWDHSLIGKAYHHAIDNEYRFYSFGDAMLIL